MNDETVQTAASASAKRQAVMFGGMSDGNLSVSFSENDLEVFADFSPAGLNGKPLDTGAITEILERINVVHGAHWDSINMALEECNANRCQVKNVLIARGTMPETEIAEYYEMNPLLSRGNKQIDSRSRINYRERSPFTIVKKGQILARLKPARPGKEGTNVHGEPLPFRTIHPEGVVGGANTRTEATQIVAEIHGQLIDNKKELSVQENLVIKGAVSYGTGNIVFPGDVSIDGPVSDGFKIYSGGSLVIKQTLDLTEVVTRGDILVSGGIIGKGSALIKSGGGIRTKFIESCHAAARKSIFVDSEIINSNIYSLGTVEMSDKGMILGGEIYAVNGLRTGKIGKKAGKTTHIHCGVDFAAQQEKEKCNNQLRLVAAKLARVKEIMDNPVPDEDIQAKMETLYLQLEEEQKTATARIAELMGRINSNENAVVEVLGEFAPGTLIEICQIALFVEEPLRKVRIRLDRAGGKLVSEPL